MAQSIRMSGMQREATYEKDRDVQTASSILITHINAVA
jgi:hypothetical protein